MEHTFFRTKNERTGKSTKKSSHYSDNQIELDFIVQLYLRRINELQMKHSHTRGNAISILRMIYSCIVKMVSPTLTYGWYLSFIGVEHMIRYRSKFSERTYTFTMHEIWKLSVWTLFCRMLVETSRRLCSVCLTRTPTTPPPPPPHPPSWTWRSIRNSFLIISHSNSRSIYSTGRIYK